jgi:hypothetical protein
MLCAAHRLCFVKVAKYDQIRFRIPGQVPHRPPQQRPVLLDLLLSAAIPQSTSTANIRLKPDRSLRLESGFLRDKKRQWGESFPLLDGNG